MQSALEFVKNNSGIFIVAMALMILLILVLTIVNALRIGRLTKKYRNFMGGGEKGDLPIEGLLHSYLSEVRTVSATQTELETVIADISKQLSSCYQKMGMVRYNPFEDMGGDQCYAVALLDESDSGVVLNGIYTRTSSFTYAKPIENGESTYTLSAEEIKAVDIARKGQIKFRK